MSVRTSPWVMLLAACSKPPASPPPDHAHAAGGSAPAESVPAEVVKLAGDPEMPKIVITARGVYYGRTKLDRIAEGLARAHEAMPMNRTIVYALATAPVRAIVDTIGGVRSAGWVRAEVYTVDGEQRHLLCDANWEDPLPDPDESVTLSIEMMRDRVWVGMSKVNEFEEIPSRGGEQDFDKLETTLKEHRASAFFADRRDAQLAFDSDIPTAVALRALETTCHADFNGIHLVPPGELAARVQR